MFKKLITMCLTIAMAASAVPVFADDVSDNSGEVVRYDCTNVSIPNSGTGTMKDSISSISATVFSQGEYGSKTSVAKVNAITYPERKYLKPCYNDSFYISTSMADLYDELNDSFSTDMWFNLPRKTSTVLMSINDNAKQSNGLFEIFYSQSEGFLRVYRKMQNTDGATNLTCYKYNYSFSTNNWYHLAISLNETNGAIEPPTLLINGTKLSPNGTDNSVTADNGYSPVEFGVNDGEKHDQIVFSQGKVDGITYNNGVKYSKISLYNKALTEAELREKYETELGYYEPEYDIVVYDGLGSKVAQSGLNSIFSAGAATPSITIDTSTVTGSDITLFNEDTVIVTDMTENKQLTLTGTATDAVYTVTSDEFVAGHEYLLTIDESVSDLRTKAQKLEFSTTADVPELVSEYKMNTGEFVESVSGNTTVLKNSALTTDYKYDNAFYVPTKDQIPSYALNEKENETFKGQYTVDLWFRKDAVSKYDNMLLYSVTDKKSYYMAISRVSGGLGIMLAYKRTDGKYTLRTYKATANYTAKAWNHLIVAYDPSTNTVTGMLNGTAKTFSGPFTGDYSTTSKIPDGAVPATPENNLTAYFNGTASMDDSSVFMNTWGGFISQNNIGAISIFKGAATKAYMQYLSGLNTDRYDYSYDLTLYQNGNEIAKEDLVNLKEGNIEAKINMTETATLSNNIYLINEDGEKITGTVTWSTNEDVTTASVAFADVTYGDYDLVIDAGVSIGTVVRKSDYVLPVTVVKQPTIELTADGDVVTENTSVAGKTVSASAKLEGADSAVLIVARYSGTTLVDVTTSKDVVDDTITISNVAVGSGESVKVMLFESLSSLVPIISCKSY